MFLRYALKKCFVTPEIEASFEKIPKSVGSFGYDPWGYNHEGAQIWMGALKPLFDKYFRVKTVGLEHIPAQGRVLVVANHGGQLPIDGALIGVALATNPYAPRAPRHMVDRWVPTIPYLGNAFNEAGAVLGDPVNCAKMLRNEEAVVVFPEGVRGSGKPFRKRYQLQRFGQGFMHLAINEKTPIVPVGVVGCEEIIPSLANVNILEHLLRMPYFPLCP
ncbi:MAG: lysophospholipid acyltransferase family protein, partial [Gammaproteobacteria bacterium]